MDTLSHRSRIAPLLAFTICRLPRRRLLECLIAAATVSLVTTAPAADVVSTWGGSTGPWTDSARWDSVLFPNNGKGGFTYDAVLTNGGITLDQDIVIEKFALSGGGLLDTTAFTLTLNDLFTWSGGTINDIGTLQANGGMALSGTTKSLRSRTINNVGAANWTAGDFNTGLGGTFTNQASGTFATNFDGGFFFNLGGAQSQFNNAGTFTKSGGSGSTTFTSLFNNTGTVNANSGTIAFNGDYTQTAGLLSLNGGGVSASTPLAVQGGQVVGNGTLSGSLNNSGGMILPGFSVGTLIITGNLSFGATSSYQCELSSSSALADKIVANSVSIASGSTFSLTDLGSGTLPLDTAFVVIENTSATEIAGRFANLADDAIVAVNGNTFQASYVGGTGNDLTLTVVPATPTPTPTASPTPIATPTPSPTATSTPAATPTPSATPTPTPKSINISGTISYCSNPVPGPVPDVMLTLTGSSSDSTLTDDSGNYTFSALATGGSYIVTPSKAALTPGSKGIDIFDAMAVQGHFLDRPIPPGCQRDAADVNGDNRIDTSDVVAIQRFYVGRPFGTANVGKYQFTPVNRSYPGLVTNQTDQNYDTLVFGDVVAGFVHRPEGPSQDAAGDDGTNAGEVPVPMATLSLPNVAVDAFVTNFILQLTTTAIDAKNKLIGFQGDFTFDERVVTFQSEPVQKAGLTAGNWNVLGNVLDGPGPIRTLRISAYSNDLTPLSGSGTLFELRMNKVSQAAGAPPLIWATPSNQFIFIDADLNAQKPANAAPGSVTSSISSVERGR